MVTVNDDGEKCKLYRVNTLKTLLQLKQYGLYNQSWGKESINLLGWRGITKLKKLL